MNGFELAVHLREKTYFEEIKTILIACSALEYEDKLLKNKGFNCGLLKPITLEQLRELFLKYDPILL